MTKTTPDSMQKLSARLLRVVVSFIEKANPDEIDALINGRASLSIVKKRSAASVRQLSLEMTESTRSDLSSLAMKLQSLKSRDEGQSLLASASLSRKELEKLGRDLKISILKTDNIERLTMKIIEASIGSRLSSEAIRGSSGA